MIESTNTVDERCGYICTLRILCNGLCLRFAFVVFCLHNKKKLHTLTQRKEFYVLGAKTICHSFSELTLRYCFCHSNIKSYHLATMQYRLYPKSQSLRYFKKMKERLRALLSIFESEKQMTRHIVCNFRFTCFTMN